MDGRDTKRDQELRRLRRKVAESWPDGLSKEIALQVLDEMVLELHQATADSG